ncbi:hypothetical protein B0H66DRAFT_589411 [Apodospora peruviana]|uniref:Uncharacterized protein n=1 Tax=Apodospora peruviana TaxID=516989 RepID=A0AAE0IKN2_9PEZI|nr:hypothetical protein B0H66DRAFT_589411 [Apodospora peruviana]
MDQARRRQVLQIVQPHEHPQRQAAPKAAKKTEDAQPAPAEPEPRAPEPAKPISEAVQVTEKDLNEPYAPVETSTIIALALACIPNLAAADCFKGSNKRPDHPLEVINFFYNAGCELQGNKLEKNKEFKKTGKSTDEKCLNVLVKNHGDTRTVTSDEAVAAWAREWTGCEHGGKRTDGTLEYIWHLDC